MLLPTRTARIIAIVSFFSVCLLLITQLAAGDLKPEIGDWSTRYLAAIDYKDANLFGSLFSVDMLTAIWPPGHSAFYQMVLSASDPRTPEEAFFFYSFISIVFWGMGVVAAYLAARQTMPAFFAYLVVPVMMASPMIQRYSYSGMTDILSISLFLIATFLVVLYLTKDRISLAILAGLVMLLASTMRHEVMIYAFILFLYLLLVKKIRAAFLYGVFAGGLATFRVIYAFTLDLENESNFIRNNQRDLQVVDSVKELVDLLNKVWITEEVFLVYCLIIVFCSLILLLFAFFSKTENINPVYIQWPNDSRHGAIFVVVLTTIVLAIVASTISGSSISHARYAMPVLPFLGLASLWMAALAFERIKGFPVLVKFLAFPLLILTVIVFVDSQIRFQENRPRFLPQDEEIIVWLKRQKAELVLFDYLAYKEFPILATLQIPGSDQENWVWASKRMSSRSFPEELEAFERMGDKVTFDAHTYIADVRPKYLVLASDKRHEIIVARSERLRTIIPHRFRDSYLRPFLMRNGDFECLNSPYVTESPCFRISFENQNYKVLERLRVEEQSSN